MPDPIETKRSWFRFSLRTMLIVVTLFAAWVAYGVNWKREREAVIAELDTPMSQGFAFSVDDIGIGHPKKHCPLTLRLVGAKRYTMILISSEFYSEDYRQRVRSLFPEAEVE